MNSFSSVIDQDKSLDFSNENPDDVFWSQRSEDKRIFMKAFSQNRSESSPRRLLDIFRESESAQSSSSKEKSWQSLQQDFEQQSSIRLYTKKCLMEIVHVLSDMDKDFSDFILNFVSPQNCDRVLREIHNYDMEKVAKTTSAVDLIEKLTNVVKNRTEILKYSNALNIFCESFLELKEDLFIKDHQIDFQKMLIIFFKTIEEGLAVGNPGEADRFHKIFFGKVTNKFVRRTNDGKRILKRKEELEPLKLFKCKEGIEASVCYAFDLAKERAEDQTSEEFDKIVWIAESPKILTLVFTDEKPQNQDFELLGQNELLVFPKEIPFEQYYEKNKSKVKKLLKKQKEEWEAENSRIQKEIEAHHQKKSFLEKLPGFEKELEDLKEKDEKDKQLSEYIKSYKKFQLPELKDLENKKNNLKKPNRRTIPKDEFKERYVLKRVLVSEINAGFCEISSKTFKEYQSFCNNFADVSQSKRLISPIYAFYMKEKTLESQENFEIKPFIEQEEPGKAKILTEEEKQEESLETHIEEKHHSRNLEAQIERKQELNEVSFGLDQNNPCVHFEQADYIEFLFKNRYKVLSLRHYSNPEGAPLVTAEGLFGNYDVSRLEKDDIYFKENQEINQRLREEYDKYILFLDCLQKVFDFKLSGLPLTALLVAFYNLKKLEDNVYSKSSLTHFSNFIYQVMILDVFLLIEQLIREGKEEEKEAVENMKFVIFCLNHTWTNLDCKYQNQIKLFFHIIGITAKKRKLKEILKLVMWKWSETMELEDLNIINRVQVLVNKLEAKNLNEKNLPDYKVILEKYADFQKSLKISLACEKHEKTIERILYSMEDSKITAIAAGMLAANSPFSGLGALILGIFLVTKSKIN